VAAIHSWLWFIEAWGVITARRSW